jgi:hypothetical protein
LLAFLVAGFAGALVAQVLAVSTNAGEEYILVFMATVLLAIVTTIPFFIAQFFSNAVRAIDRMLLWSLAVFAVALIIFVIYTRAWEAELGIIAGFVLPGAAIIVFQWLIVRGFARQRMRETALGQGEAS